jgi:hypothetical protein
VPLLLVTKDTEGVLHLYEPRSLPVDVVPAHFGTLNYDLPSQYGLLFLPESQFLVGLWLAPPLLLLLLLL